MNRNENPSLRNRRLALAAGVAGLALLAAACGDDDSVAAADPTSVTEVAATPDEVVVGLVDYGFEDLPATVEAGTRFAIHNESATELHELVAFRVPDGDDRSVGELLAAADGFGAPAMVLLQAPGSDETITAVGDGTLSEPGRYVVLCSIPTGADPAEYLAAAAESQGGPPQGVAGGPPHLVHGMVGELVVE
jgi:hypothetical protein